jgi:thiol-disulfide isomerase/thioredoxin
MTTVTEQQKPDEKKRLAPWLVGLVIAIVVFGVGLIIANALGFGDDPTFGDPDAAATDEVGGPAETDGLTFAYLDGSSGSFADFGGKPLVVNFWASWCPACVAEMPDLEQVHALFEDEVQFLGVNLTETDPDAALRLIDETGVTYTMAQDPEGLLYRQFDGIAMPTSVFIDEQGNVLDTHSGAIFAADLEERLREVFDL